MNPPRLHRVNPLLLERARATRHSPSRPEQKLWQCLRNRRLNGFKFRRPYSMGRYILYFYCAQCRLIVELDGESRNRQIERDAWLTREGIRVLRDTNDDSFDYLDAVLEAILKECEERP